MKGWLWPAISVILLAAALSSLGWAELTKEDVIQIIRSELEPIKLAIAEIKGKMVTKDAFYGTLILMWVTIIAAIITIPYLYGRADRERVRELETRLREEEKRIEEVAASVEALKAALQREEKLREAAQRVAQERPEFAEAFKRIGLL